MNQVTQYIGQSVWIVTFDRLLRGTDDGPEYHDQPFNRVIGWTNNRGIDRLCERSDKLDNTRTINQ